MALNIRQNFALIIHRFSYYSEYRRITKKIPVFQGLFNWLSLCGRSLSVICCRIYIPSYTVVGKNIWFSPKGNIILGAQRIGNNCRVHHNVTFGQKVGVDINTRKNEKPTVGNNVWIGPNSLIYGDIQIGDGVTVLEGSIVSKNLPNYCVVSGNPAKIIRNNFDNSRLLTTDFSGITCDNIDKWH